MISITGIYEKSISGSKWKQGSGKRIGTYGREPSKNGMRKTILCTTRHQGGVDQICSRWCQIFMWHQSYGLFVTCGQRWNHQWIGCRHHWLSETLFHWQNDWITSQKDLGIFSSKLPYFHNVDFTDFFVKTPFFVLGNCWRSHNHLASCLSKSIHCRNG